MFDTQIVLTIEELAQFFETKQITLQVNFHRHKNAFTEKRDYYILTGETLHQFLAEYPEKIPWHVHKPGRMRRLSIWTESGTLIHARFLNSARAWPNYDKITQRFHTIIINSTLVEASPLLLVNDNQQ